MSIQDFPKVTVILRGYTYSQVRTVVKNLIGSKLGAVEITMNTPNAIGIIEKINQEFGSCIKIGAGTITTYEEAQAAIKAGATFILSPIQLDKKIIDLCKKNNVIVVPASFTPTEIKQSLDDGADIVKVFPAGTLGPKFISDVQAPLGKLPLMVVGGVNADNMGEFFKAGAMFAGIGSGIFVKKDILDENEEELKKSIKHFESKWELGVCNE